MSLKVRQLVLPVGGGVILIVGILVLISLQYEVAAPSDWPSELKLYRKTLTGETQVVDGASGRVLFMYRPEYDKNVHPVSIKKIDSNHWQVVFEAPAK